MCLVVWREQCANFSWNLLLEDCSSSDDFKLTGNKHDMLDAVLLLEVHGR